MISEGLKQGSKSHNVERGEGLTSVFSDLFLSIYRYLGFGILFAVIAMIALPSIEEKGLRKTFKELAVKLRSDHLHLCRFIFFIFLFMILSRTLICRNIWFCPWENVIGEWRLLNSDNELNVEVAENLILFVPLTTFGLFSGFQKIDDMSNRQLFICGLKWSFGFTLFIECCQLFLRLGTFQFSDIAQNTAGGGLGCIIYILVKAIQNRWNDNGRKNNRKK